MKTKLSLPSLLIAFSMSSNALAWSLPAPIQADRELPAGAFARSTNPQLMQILDSGIASLEKRLQIIESAQKSIEAEFFIYRTDKSGTLITQALAKKAREGVKVRLLLDDTPMNSYLTDFECQKLKEAGVEVRYYNGRFLLDFKSQYRSHRKNMVIDGIHGFTGGRNIGDEYFDLHDQYNFLDRDFYIKGDLVQTMLQSFEQFWNSKYSKAREFPRKPRPSDANVYRQKGSGYAEYKQALAQYEHKMRAAQQLVDGTESDRALREKVREIGSRTLSRQFESVCNDTYFFADTPGMKPANRVVYNHLMKFARSAERSLVVETPYLITKANQNPFLESIKNNIDVKILTNSLKSTDDGLAVAGFSLEKINLLRDGVDIYLYVGVPPQDTEFISESARDGVWGIHAKSAIIDDDTVIISSFNLDPRSKDINSEMALVCRGNQELVTGLKNAFQNVENFSLKLGADGAPIQDTRLPSLKTDFFKYLQYQLVKPFAFILRDFL